MEFVIRYGDGQTPIAEEERGGLKLPVTTMDELDAVEQLNIEKALGWLIGRRMKPEQVLSEVFLRKLHRLMFNEVWRWAGKLRQSEKNIGVRWIMISREMKVLCDDALFWIDQEVFPPAEVAIRFKHRLVSIHCFPNGNGRHSRMMADVLMENVFGLAAFTWGAQLEKGIDERKLYIKTLKIADRGEIDKLLDFALSKT